MISLIPEKHKFIVETMATDGDTLVSSLSVEEESFPSAAGALNDLFPHEVLGALKHSFPIFSSYQRENDAIVFDEINYKLRSIRLLATF